MHPIFFAHLIILLDLLHLDLSSLHHILMAYIVYLCVMFNSNRFHSFIFKLCIMIVDKLKICTDDAGPEQSLVLFVSLSSEKQYGTCF